VSQPVINGIRHRFKYGVTHHFRVDGTNLNNVGTVTVTDSEATWTLPSSVSISPTSIEFDSTPTKPPGLGGTGSLTITVTNTPVSGGESGKRTTGASYTSG
jgi:hypothetical protein